MANDFSIEAPWLAAIGGSALDSTVAKLKILINRINVTVYEGETETDGACLVLPIYPFAEWLAENWWALLHEPRKREDDEFGDEHGWRLRHDITVAGQGFILPRVTFIPVGEQVIVQATKRRPLNAGIKFLKGATAMLPRGEVEATLKRFIGETVERLDQQNVRSTRLHDIFERIMNTARDEEPFCRLMGALGLSPYDDNGEIEETVIKAANQWGELALLDVCRVATPETLKQVLATARRALYLTKDSSIVDLSKLAQVQRPPNNPTSEGWRVGIQGAKRIRAAFEISDTDPTASDILFTRLGINLGPDAIDGPNRQNPLNEDTQLSVTGAIVRKDTFARVGLAQKRLVQRRFTALRATYSAWTSNSSTDIRLITQALTRDQQESRAFAAEMAAPIAFIRRESRGQRVTTSFTEELATSLGVGIDVVRYQMSNNGIPIERNSRMA